MKPIQVIPAALLSLALGAAVPAPAQLGWVDNAMKAKQALDTAQKAKEIADAAQKAKQIADAAQKAKQAADMVNKARQVQDLGNRAKQVQDLGKQIEQPQPLLRGNPVRGVPRPIRPEPRPLHDVLRQSKDWPNEHRSWVQRGGYRGYHIPNDWFNSRFGPAHSFRPNFTVAGNNPCFDFGGYSFQLVDPVPPGYADNWNQTDDVTINEDNGAGGYYLQNAKYPDGQLPSFLMSLTASDLPCSRLSLGFTVATDGSIKEDPQQDYLVQQPDQAPQQQGILGFSMRYTPQGAVIDDVIPGGPADHAGLRRGDIIVQVADVSGTLEQLIERIHEQPVGLPFTVTYLRSQVQTRVDLSTVDLLSFYKAAADKGYAGAETALGAVYHSGQGGVAKDPVEAVLWYRKAAEQGDAKAEYLLGVAYYNGEGVAKDPAEAVQWFRKAAEQGFAQAEHNLGVIYNSGQGVAKDPAEAVQWFRKAAEQGFAEAENNLGIAYYNGSGVPRDYISAYMWLSLCAAQEGNAGEVARKNLMLDGMKRLDPSERAEAERRLSSWKASP
jgi:hypothetical protein